MHQPARPPQLLCLCMWLLQREIKILWINTAEKATHFDSKCVRCVRDSWPFNVAASIEKANNVSWWPFFSIRSWRAQTLSVTIFSSRFCVSRKRHFALLSCQVNMAKTIFFFAIFCVIREMLWKKSDKMISFHTESRDFSYCWRLQLQTMSMQSSSSFSA